MEKRLKESNDPWFRDEITKFQSIEDCDKCSGFRLNEQALSVKIDELHIGEVTKFTINNMHKWINNISSKLSNQSKEIALPIIKEISDRLKFLMDVGLILRLFKHIFACS